MREIRQSGSEGGARFNPSFLPLSAENRADAIVQQALQFRPVTCQRWIRSSLAGLYPLLRIAEQLRKGVYQAGSCFLDVGSAPA
jgi:hypothetical protein